MQSRRNRAPARHLCAPCRCENAFRLPGGGVWWTRQTDPAKGIVFGDQFVLFRPPTPDAQPQAASSALTPVSRAGPVARPRPRPSFWLAGRSLVDGGIVIDVEAQALASPTSTGLVWVRTEGSSEGDAAATNHARRTRKVRACKQWTGTLSPCWPARGARARIFRGRIWPFTKSPIHQSPGRAFCMANCLAICPFHSQHPPAGEVHMQPLRHTEYQARQPPRLARRLRLCAVCWLPGRAQAAGQSGGGCLRNGPGQGSLQAERLLTARQRPGPSWLARS